MVGQNGTPYTNVQIKVDIKGPATPKLLATDSSDNEYDIAKLGYWGPPAGFAVQGDFTNTTPVKATFTADGTYTITLSLIDVSNNTNNVVITSDTFTIEVGENQNPVVNNTIVNDLVPNNTISNNVVDELPKTGTSIFEYITYFLVIGTLFIASAIYFNRKKINN